MAYSCSEDEGGRSETEKVEGKIDCVSDQVALGQVFLHSGIFVCQYSLLYDLEFSRKE